MTLDNVIQERVQLAYSSKGRIVLCWYEEVADDRWLKQHKKAGISNGKHEAAEVTGNGMRL